MEEKERDGQHIPLGDTEVLEKFKCLTPIRSLANWAPREDIPAARQMQQEQESLGRPQNNICYDNWYKLLSVTISSLCATNFYSISKCDSPAYCSGHASWCYIRLNKSKHHTSVLQGVVGQIDGGESWAAVMGQGGSQLLGKITVECQRLNLIMCVWPMDFTSATCQKASAT